MIKIEIKDSVKIIENRNKIHYKCKLLIMLIQISIQSSIA